MTDTVATPEDSVAEEQLQDNKPGQQLKLARERLNLSSEDVSTKLNLKHSFVLMIEEDNYAALPGVTFVKGYLRAYAKLVGIESEVLIESYNSLGLNEAKPEERYQPVETIKPQRSFSDPLVKYTTLTVAAALVGFSVMWWQSRGDVETVSVVQDSAVTVETAEGETVITPMDLSSADADAQIETDSEAAPTDEQVSGGEGSNLDVNPEDESSEQGSDVSSETEADNANSPVVETESEVAVQPEVPEDQIVITFTEDCWVQVVDARGIKVISNLKHGGERSVVEGLPPFKFMIGNAGGAEVTYKGEVFDLKPHTNSNSIARFTLGE